MKNEYEVRGEVTAIIINSKKHGRQEALISTNKLEKVKEFPNTWVLMYDIRVQTFYVVGKLNTAGWRTRKSILLHRIITETPDKMVVDHINHNGLDNTDENIKVCTVAENNQNKRYYSKSNQQKNSSNTGILSNYVC